MVTSRSKVADEEPRRPPATTPEARELQMVSLATDLAEKQMRAGTASPGVVTHYLKLGTVRESKERQKLEAEVELLRARVAQINDGANVEKLYSDAIAAMRNYSGQTAPEGYDDYDG